MVFEIVSIVRMVNNVLSWSVSEHFLSNHQCLCKLIDIVVIHFLMLHYLNFSLNILTLLDAFFQFFLLFFFVFLKLLSSFLHIWCWFWDDISFVIWQLSLHLLIWIHSNLINLLFVLWYVEVIVIHVSQRIFKFDIFGIVSYLLLFIFILHSVLLNESWIRAKFSRL